jgi:hypothetical protein
MRLVPDALETADVGGINLTNTEATPDRSSVTRNVAETSWVEESTLILFGLKSKETRTGAVVSESCA